MPDITPKIAYELLMEASKMNPGPWVEHSIYVAKAARRIAEKISVLDPNIAEAYGYVH